MSENQNFYEVLGVVPNATDNQIKDAYIFKANILHPDRLSGISERIRVQAEAEMKRVNEAYSTLSKPKLRAEYDKKTGIKQLNHQPQTGKRTKVFEGNPKPELFPNTIKISKSLPFIKHQFSIFLKNAGGDFNKMVISQIPGWLEVVKMKSLDGNAKLPMRIDFEAIGVKWGQKYSCIFEVRLDDIPSKINIELSMSRKPFKLF